jgi:WhiB family redox-sensing transcriptional regulator
MILDDEPIYHSWREQAACAGTDTELFYPPRDKDLYSDVATEAKKLCNGSRGQSPCPVRAECFWYAVITDEQHGIWGGMSHRERNAFVRKWQKSYKGKLTLKEYVHQERGGQLGSSK